MTFLLLLCNSRLLVWQVSTAPPATLRRQVTCGDWQVPAQVRTRLLVPPGTRFSARTSGQLVIVTPDHALTEHAPRLPAPISSEQARLLRLLRRGLSFSQAAHHLGRSDHWVRKQVRLLDQRAEE
jgi:DNA-binding NarL/FixJ family response regulator